MTGPTEPRAGGPSAARAVPRFIPAPAPLTAPPRLRPEQALDQLAGELPDGTRTTLRTDGTLAVLSTPAASVWCNGRIFWWATADGEIIWPAADAEGAARRLSDRLCPIVQHDDPPPRHPRVGRAAGPSTPMT